ncbi:MAG: YbhB/YbcL family Raf kinase inhibitor-like protein [Planctomycetota bacterium]|jgi:Raf kinase inhibitor-like YbhB/YbcL family protein
MSLDVTSWAFALENIPIEYTGNGKDISPPLEWGPGPEGTVCYALIVDDPDGPRGSWVHWVVWNIRETRLHQDVPREPVVETALSRIGQGHNSFERLGYNGPCPPSGTHRYFFKVYALDTELDLGPETSKTELLAAMKGHILDEGELMVTYCRSRALTSGKLTGPYLPLTRPSRQ